MKESNTLYFIYTGNAYPHKNLEKVILAIKNLNKLTNTNVSFFIVSSRNIFTKKLEKFIEKNKAKDFVKLLGFVEDKKLENLYKKSIGFIFPSLMEGFGLPGLEAMKSNAILLSSDIPVFREIYGNHSIYFNPKDVKSIENAMKKALSLTNIEANRIIKSNQEFIRMYSWKKMAEETIKIYNSLK